MIVGVHEKSDKVSGNFLLCSRDHMKMELKYILKRMKRNEAGMLRS